MSDGACVDQRVPLEVHAGIHAVIAVAGFESFMSISEYCHAPVTIEFPLVK